MLRSPNRYTNEEPRVYMNVVLLVFKGRNQVQYVKYITFLVN